VETKCPSLPGALPRALLFLAYSLNTSPHTLFCNFDFLPGKDIKLTGYKVDFMGYRYEPWVGS